MLKVSADHVGFTGNVVSISTTRAAATTFKCVPLTLPLLPAPPLLPFLAHWCCKSPLPQHPSLWLLLLRACAGSDGCSLPLAPAALWLGCWVLVLLHPAF